MSDVRHVVVVGMMGSGKTTVGRQVAAIAGLDFHDSDELVEATTGRTVAEIFEAEGEAAFRAHEHRALEEMLAAPEPSVIAAAGGSVLDAANRELMREAGTVVWLRADPAVLVERTRSGDHRPLLAHDRAGVLARLSAEREHLYAEVADVIVDVDDLGPAEAADRVAEELRALGAIS